MAKLFVVLFIGYKELHSQAGTNVSAHSICAGNTERFVGVLCNISFLITRQLSLSSFMYYVV